MDALTHEETLLSVSSECHDSSSATPVREEPIRDTSDNLDAIWEVDYQADDIPLAAIPGAHGSYGSIHLLTFPPIYVLKSSVR